MSEPTRISIWVVLACIAAALSLLLAPLSGLGHRWGWWSFTTGFGVLRWALYTAIAGCVLAIVALILLKVRPGASGMPLAMGALVLSALILVIPLNFLVTARSVPAIHDITTDTANPPTFRAVLALRGDAANPLEYGGEAIARQQLAAYPDIRPLILAGSPAQAFAAALAGAKGWEIVSASEPEGRIEAVATTFWFGFKDDVVVRILPQDGASRVDVRSVSRVGRSDVGANAERIRDYLKRVEQAWKESA